MTSASGSRSRRSSAVLAFAVALAGPLSFSCASTPPSTSRAPETAARSVPPKALVGNWLLEVKIGSRNVEGGLHFANSNGVLVGTETSAEGNEFELKKISIAGDRVSWDVDGSAGSQYVTGKIDGLSMKGAPAEEGGGRDRSAGASDDPSPGGSPGGRSGGGRAGHGRGRSGSGGGSAEITWSA